MHNDTPSSLRSSAAETVLTCPVCFDPLSVGPSVASCAKNHTFDRAREGYLNLLLANQKGSSDPSDDRESVTARREFLAAGHYNFLAECLSNSVVQNNKAPKIVVDSGCGEGFYLNHIAGRIPGSSTYGLDISRSAMRLASRSYGNCTWAVANIARRLPVSSGCCDVLLSVMAPRNASEFERILRPDGRLIVVTPGDGHLRELADKLMAEPSDQSEKAETLTQQLTPTLTRQTTESVRTSFTADQQTIQRLVTMTPLRWKSQKRVVSGLADIERLDITASFTLMTFSLTT